MNTFEILGHAALTLNEGNRQLGYFLAHGAKRLKRMFRTYVELSGAAAAAKLRTWR